MRKSINALVTFPSAQKEIVSGLEMMNFVSGIIFKHYGEGIRLAGIERFRWPYPLPKEEEAFLRIVDRGKKTISDVPLRFISVRMLGTKSQKVVMYGLFEFIEM